MEARLRSDWLAESAGPSARSFFRGGIDELHRPGEWDSRTRRLFRSCRTGCICTAEPDTEYAGAQSALCTGSAGQINRGRGARDPLGTAQGNGCTNPGMDCDCLLYTSDAADE